MVTKLVKPKNKLPLKSKHGAVAKPKSKKLKPASIEAQKAWKGFSPKLKKELKRTLPDTDKDGVPNGFDCRPRNKKKQESFLPDDAAFLNSNPEIKLGARINSGFYGEVFSIQGNRNLVVKVPRYVVNPPPEKKGKFEIAARWGVEKEMKHLQDYGLNDEPLFIPTQIVHMKSDDPDIADYIGLIRPKVAILTENTNKSINQRNLKRVTYSALRDLRNKIIELSYKGYAFRDGLQIGIDVAGRLLVYDYGHVDKYYNNDAYVFSINNDAWIDFLLSIGKDTMDDRSKIGEITRSR